MSKCELKVGAMPLTGNDCEATWRDSHTLVFVLVFKDAIQGTCRGESDEATSAISYPWEDKMYP